MSDSVVIVSASRTPIGQFDGGLSSLAATDLGAISIEETLRRGGVFAKEVDEVVMGQVLTAGCGQNPARQAAMAAEIPCEKTALTVNQVCGSGLRSVVLAWQSIMAGDASIVVAGGQESMSQAPHALHLRKGTKMGSAEMIDTMVVDGLWDSFNDYHMGMTAENLADKFSITREQQDDFAAWSQQKAERAMKDGLFQDEIVPVTISSRNGDTVIELDEQPRFGTTSDALSALRPVFKKDGTVTAGNASTLNDAASSVLLMRESEAVKRGLKPLAQLVSWATRGVDPSLMGTGPIGATNVALKKAGWSVDDLDLIESNEAFAVQALTVTQELGFDPDKVNVNGGAIALGHPIGASGTRILISLMYEMQRRGVHRGLATLCIGGGMGISLCIEGIY